MQEQGDQEGETKHSYHRNVQHVGGTGSSRGRAGDEQPGKGDKVHAQARQYTTSTYKFEQIEPGHAITVFTNCE